MLRDRFAFMVWLQVLVSGSSFASSDSPEVSSGRGVAPPPAGAPLLALEMSSDACSVALVHGDRRFAVHLVEARMHARRVLPLIETVLSDAGLAVGMLGGIVYGRGPGSFTGLRIGCAVAQGLAWAQDLPTLGLSSLHARAQAAFRRGDSAPTVIALVVDARMGESFGATYRCAEGGAVLEAHLAEHIGPTLEVQAAVLADAARCGGHRLYLSDLGDANTADRARTEGFEVSDDVEPTAEALLDIASAVDSSRWSDAHSVQPVYLSDERRWRKQGSGRS